MRRSGLVFGFLAVAASGLTAPASGQSVRTIQVCAIDSGELVEVSARYNTVTGDTTIGDRLFHDVYMSNASHFAASHSWYVNNEAIDHLGRTYVKYGLPRVLGIDEIEPIATLGNVPIFAEAGSSPPHDVIYAAVRIGCEFQPYQVEVSEEIGVRGELFPGEWVSGTLTSQHPVDENDYPFEMWGFLGLAGETVYLDLESEDFDPVVQLMVDRDGVPTALARDDDGGGYPNSHIEYELTEDGIYQVMVMGFPESRGAYDLWLDLVGASGGSFDLRGWQEIRSGQTIGDELATDDFVYEDGAYYDRFAYVANAGESVVIEMRSDAFDAFVAIEAAQSGDYETLASDDDSHDDPLDSLLRYTFPRSGVYFIRATTFGSGGTGSYEVSIRRTN